MWSLAVSVPLAVIAVVLVVGTLGYVIDKLAGRA
jgi:hypothetical protein